MTAHGRPGRTGDNLLRRPRYITAREPVVESLSVGLCAVHTADGSATRIFYCEPATGRCSCGAPWGPCQHIARASALLAHPLAQRRSA